MPTNEPHAEERIARETYHDAQFALVDGSGAAHYFSRYHQAVVIVEGDQTATVELPVSADGHRIDSLGDWLAYTRAERGVEHHRVSRSLADDLHRSVRV
jgi:hypothetical protein